MSSKTKFFVSSPRVKDGDEEEVEGDGEHGGEEDDGGLGHVRGRHRVLGQESLVVQHHGGVAGGVGDPVRRRHRGRQAAVAAAHAGVHVHHGGRRRGHFALY